MSHRSNTAPPAFKLKGTTPALTLLALQTDDVQAIERQLAEHVSQMPHFFLHAPVLVDLEGLAGRPFDFTSMAEVLRRHRLVPVAVRNPTDPQRELAVSAGWGVLQSSLVRPARGAVSSPPREEPAHSAPVAVRASEPPRRQPAPVEPPPAGLTVRHPVRSGQVVYAAGGDLVVLAQVSSGAELIADGNIHVYAPLRGRALAGANDNADASIFCMCLDAEFLSIAGRALVSDDIPEERRGRPARVHLLDGRVVVSSLG